MRTRLPFCQSSVKTKGEERDTIMIIIIIMIITHYTGRL